jgi:hypothetical protein
MSDAVNHKLHANIHIAKNCKLAPALIIMPWLDDFIFVSGGRGCGPDWANLAC